jgi:hypothetical protein
VKPRADDARSDRLARCRRPWGGHARAAPAAHVVRTNNGVNAVQRGLEPRKTAAQAMTPMARKLKNTRYAASKQGAGGRES